MNTINKYDYTTYCEITFQTPQYNGSPHYIYSRQGDLLAEIHPSGKLTIYRGYSWDVWKCIGEDEITVHGESVMYLPSLVLDVLRQMYRHSHGLNGYDKVTIHKYYKQLMKECGLCRSKTFINYSFVRVAAIWRKVSCKWRC